MRALARGGWRPSRQDRVLLAVLALTALALALRLYDLGARAVHHDESLHAVYAWYLAEGRGYEHNPLMHGPLQFHLIAGLFRLLGDSEVTARLPAALAGGALVASPLLLRRWLGGAGTVAAALLIALSPSLLYFSRFARNDVLVALWTLLLVAAIWRYRQTGGARWLALLAAALALSFATKETVYLTVAMLLLYLDGALALELLARRGRRGWRRALEAAILLPSAWLIAAGWRPLVSRLRLGERPREADLLVVLGTLTLPFLAAMAAPSMEPLAAVLLLLAAAAAVGLAWDWRRWAPLAALFLAIAVPLYTTGFTNAGGFLSGFWGSLDYWIEQQGVRRGTQPGFYYLMLLPLYEFLVLLPVLAGGAWLLWRGDLRTRLLAPALAATSLAALFAVEHAPGGDAELIRGLPLYEFLALLPALAGGGLLLRRADPLTRLLAWWFAATLIALSLAGEKMPWLTVHLALPLALLAGHALSVALPAASRALGRVSARAATVAVAGAGVLLLLLSLRTAAGVAYAHPDTPLEPLIYTQTSPDVPALAREIEAFADAGPGRDQLLVTVDSTASFAWPWAWYLRDFPRTRYLGPAAIAEDGGGDGVLIAARSTLDAQPQLAERFPGERPYRHRWWFPEQRYKSITAGELLDGIRDRSLLADWAAIYIGGVDESTLGSIDGAVLFPASPAARSREP